MPLNGKIRTWNDEDDCWTSLWFNIFCLLIIGPDCGSTYTIIFKILLLQKTNNNLRKLNHECPRQKCTTVQFFVFFLDIITSFFRTFQVFVVKIFAIAFFYRNTQPPPLSIEDREEKVKRCEFAQGLLLSTILVDNL